MHFRARARPKRASSGGRPVPGCCGIINNYAVKDQKFSVTRVMDDQSSPTSNWRSLKTGPRSISGRRLIRKSWNRSSTPMKATAMPFTEFFTGLNGCI